MWLDSGADPSTVALLTAATRDDRARCSTQMSHKGSNTAVAREEGRLRLLSVMGTDKRHVRPDDARGSMKCINNALHTTGLSCYGERYSTEPRVPLKVVSCSAWYVPTAAVILAELL